MFEESGEKQLADFWFSFTEKNLGRITFTCAKLLPEPTGEHDGKWRTSNWGTTLILDGTYRDSCEKQEFTTRNSAPSYFFEYASKKYPALVFFLECTIPEDNFFGVGLFTGGEFVTGQSGTLYETNINPVHSEKYAE